MIIEIVFLALVGAIRPASLAAVYTLLSADSRRVLMCAYVAAGLAFTIAFGLLVVYVLHGIHVASGTDRTKAVADIIGGTAAVAFGVAILTGRVRPSKNQDAPGGRRRWTTLKDHRLTAPIAAAAGPATHLPGLFYLIALNVIVAHNERAVGGTLAVVTYNLIWFALPLAALAICVVRPAAARDAVGLVDQWARAHARSILLSVSFIVGAALVVRGALAL